MVRSAVLPRLRQVCAARALLHDDRRGQAAANGEDCVSLNVVTCEAAGGEPLPVMVFVHGGGYIFGSSATSLYDGVALACRGCMYVSVNYRLGALGCLDLSSWSTTDITLDSNLFLRDLVLALRWVRDNIAEFSGRPGERYLVR